ncbi:TolC family protein, partial [bacterium]|nr:TolC family protein [bacterium]
VREDYNYSKDIMIAKVIRAYYSLFRNKMLLEVREESKLQARKNLDRSKAFLDAGSATRVDMLKAQVRYSNTKLDVINARNAMEMAREEIKSLMNRREDSFFSIDTSMTIEYKKPELENEIEYAFNNRADLKSMRYSIKAAKSNISAAKAGWWPSFGVNINYYWNDRKLVDNPLDMFREEYQWSVTGFMSFSIFDRMSTSTKVKSAKADQRIAEYNLEKRKLSAVKEIKNLIFGMNEARERITVANEIIIQAEEEVKLAEERYRIGAGTMLETIDAHVALTTARADLVKAKCDYLVAEADLARAAGKMSGQN